MDVLLTGAHGVVGTAITTHSDHDYTLLDIEEPSAELSDGTTHPHADRETVLVDVGDPDAVGPLADAMADCEAVVHLAGNPSTEASYGSAERDNVRGTRNVYEAASKAGISGVVFASSNHAVGMYETEHAPALYDPEYDLTVDHESPTRPDSDYGSSKAAGEAWGRQYAELEGLDVYALRIGSVRAPTYDHPFGDAERGVARGDYERGDDAYDEQVDRMRCTWLSRRDAAHLVDCCLADSVDGDAGDGNGTAGSDDTVAGGAFEVFYGISDNPNSWFDIEHARERVGYDPRDDGSAMESPPDR